MTTPTLLWLDDERDPSDARWHVYFPISNSRVIWLRDYEEFVQWITENGLPDAICFDHDLGAAQNGFDAAKWLTEYCLNSGCSIPVWNIQSANPVGKENIVSILKSFERTIG